MVLAVEPLAPARALIHGVNLADPATRERGDELVALLLARQVLFFREQKLSPAELVNVARLFGDVAPVASTFAAHPENEFVEILRSSGRRTGTDVWHSDLSWLTSPPMGACLLAVETPACGGDTIWTSMTAAHDSLSPAFRDYLSTLTGLHDWECAELLARINEGPDAKARYARMRRDHPPIAKKVIAVHPRSGRAYIDVNQLYTTRLLGAPAREAEATLRALTSLATTPEWQTRFRWAPGSVAVWDNRATQHYAVNDYHPHPRLMHRVTIHDRGAE